MVSRADTRTTSNCVLYGSEKKSMQMGNKKTLPLSLSHLGKVGELLFSISGPRGDISSGSENKRGGCITYIGSQKDPSVCQRVPFFSGLISCPQDRKRGGGSR